MPLFPGLVPREFSEPLRTLPILGIIAVDGPVDSEPHAQRAGSASGDVILQTLNWSES